MSKSISKTVSLPILWSAAIACLLIGLAFGIPTRRYVRQAGARLESQHRLIARLQAMRAAIAPLREVRQAFQRSLDRQPLPFGMLAEGSAPPGATLRVADPVPVPASSWALHRVDVEWTGQADIGAVLSWASEIEKLGRNENDGTPSHPPWRLAQIVARAAPARPGHGEMRLQFEAVGRNNP